MWHVYLRAVLAHKVRLGFTAVAVVIAVASISGTFVLTDTLNTVFDDLFGQKKEDTTVVVRGKPAPAVGTDTSTHDGVEQTPSVPDSVLARVRAVPGVGEAVGEVSGYARIVPPLGKPATTGASTRGIDWTNSTLLSPVRDLRGRPPKRFGEVAVDTVTADRYALQLGERVGVLTRRGQHRAAVVGIFRVDSASNAAHARLTAFDPATAQRLLLEPGHFSDVRAIGRKGLSSRELGRRVRHVLPPEVEAVSGSQLSEETAYAVAQGMSFFTSLLLVFAGIALFVGAFVIFNTFSMLVVQRTRNFALLRALGASRSQVRRFVLIEALVVGLTGSLVGLGGGLLVATGLRWAMAALGIELPSTPLVIEADTVAESLGIGVLVTLLSAAWPARRAGRVPVMAALREDAVMPPRSLRRRVLVGALVTAAGVAVGGLGLRTVADRSHALVGVGAALVFIGIAELSPLFSRPVVRLLGAPFPGVFGMAGRLANENALRDPRRTSGTAAAVMVGLAFVTGFTVIAASAKMSTDRLVDRGVGADFVVSSASYLPFAPEAARRIARADGVQNVTSLRVGPAKVGASSVSLTAVTPSGIEQMLRLEMVRGSASPGVGELLVDADVARERKWRPGRDVVVEFAFTGPTRLRLVGIYRPNALVGGYLISTQTYARNFAQNLDMAVLVAAEQRADDAAVRRAIEGAITAYPTLAVKDQTEFKEDQRRSVNQLLGLVLALLFLAILIAVLGIVNTLALSVFERTRELGLLRAIGMSRRQLRWMVRLESVTISMFGAVLGLAVGLVFGWAVVRALRPEGITVLRIPLAQLALYVVLAAVMGVVAAVAPARRAARMDVLQAIAAE